ncbi:phosphoenolpyruvate--protein phosphotransferase [Oleidesulfovibrio alaskensis]|uniref:phosphoenolpyruvate--protein phosphotransferase n=1 Tax=Oleidesulfovibrio alaskensis TaxID=58180 RepID=UPI0003F95864|nr:phosphoenolpyruvate--protein phosphotransferase [Oleidesulfovibrio alaskensis]
MARLILHGIPVSAGISIGKAFFAWRDNISTLPRGIVTPGAAQSEVERLESAVEAVQNELTQARNRVPAELKDHAAIIDSHLLIAADPKLIKDAARRIQEQNITAEWALEQAVEAIALAFSSIEDDYIRERVQDVRVVADRISKRLMGASGCLKRPLQERMVLMAHDLAPADTMELPLDKIMSFATSEGGKTSHTGILARSMLIPAVVGVSNLEEHVNDGDLVIVDALRGFIIVDPNEDELADYTELKFQFEAYQKALHKECRLPAETVDGYRVEVVANIEMTEEVAQVLDSGGEGVGLYRTEYAYLSRPALPTEDQLYEEYSELASIMAPGKVIFRTLDVGADKMLTEQTLMREPNPALGLRAIRYCLRNIDVFKTQLRAILRASVHGNVALMFPMISGLQELRQAKVLLNEVRMELDRARQPYNPNMPVGIMIELPSAVLIADSLAQEVDFFSIGTNDLIQYSLGIDRGNKHVSYLYQPQHPAIVRSIKFVVDAAHREGIEVSVCGEVAADPYCIPILLGMQIDAISIAPQSIPGIKRIIRRTNMEECKTLLNEVLRTATVARINRVVKDTIFKQFPEELTFYSSLIDHDD